MFTAVSLLSADRLLLPEDTLHAGWFAVRAAFVAVNTVMYAALAPAKIYPSDWTRERNRRDESRSIYPQPPD